MILRAHVFSRRCNNLPAPAAVRYKKDNSNEKLQSAVYKWPQLVYWRRGKTSHVDVLAMETDDRTLDAHNVLPMRGTASLLVVGAEGTGKHDLSLAILKIPVQFSVQIRTASTLPLPSKHDADRPRIDFICFILNMADRDSVQVVEKSLSLVDVQYFLGRACLVVTDVRNPRKMTDLDQVTTLADSFNLPLLFGEIKVERERDQLARRILCLAEIAAGLKGKASPLLVEATKATPLL